MVGSPGYVGSSAPFGAPLNIALSSVLDFQCLAFRPKMLGYFACSAPTLSLVPSRLGHLMLCRPHRSLMVVAAELRHVVVGTGPAVPLGPTSVRSSPGVVETGVGLFPPLGLSFSWPVDAAALVELE